MSALTSYYDTVQQALTVYQNTYDLIEQVYLQSPDPDYDASVNWSDILFNLQDTISRLQQMMAIDRFERLTKDQMQLLFSNYETGVNNGKIVYPLPYSRRPIDTLRSLAYKFNVTEQDILDYNGLTTSGFYSAAQINIPLLVDIIQRNTNVIVYGDQTGQNILGVDMSLPIAADPATGDILLLAPPETFEQDMENLMATQLGELPFYETHGIDFKVSEEYPSATVAPALQQRISDGVNQDQRVKSISFSNIIVQGNVITMNVIIETISGNQFILPASNQ